MESPQIYSAKGSESSLSEQGGDSFVPQMPSALSELPHAPALSYLQKLQKIETNAKAEIAAFDSMYQSQLRGSAAGSKRKGMVLMEPMRSTLTSNQPLKLIPTRTRTRTRTTVMVIAAVTAKTKMKYRTTTQIRRSAPGYQCTTQDSNSPRRSPNKLFLFSANSSMILETRAQMQSFSI
jgi:hypothetical protein